MLRMSEKKYNEAETLLKRALRVVESTRGPEDPSMVIPLRNLVQLYQETGRPEPAEKHRARLREVFARSFNAEVK
jgi:hypothetical protein